MQTLPLPPLIETGLTGIMNAAFAVSTSPDYFDDHDRTIPAAVFEVYLAFDAGEYCRPGDAEDLAPESKYTQPLIARFLAGGEKGRQE